MQDLEALKILFQNNEFIQKGARWEIEFKGKLRLRVDGETGQDHLDFMKYVESKKDYLQTKLPSSLGEWRFQYKEGVIKRVEKEDLSGL